MKTRTFSLLRPKIRKTLALVSLSILPVFASAPSFAARHHVHVAPTPSPVSTQDPGDNRSDHSGLAALLGFVAILLLIAVLYMSDKLTKTRERNHERVHELKMEIGREERQSTHRYNEIRELNKKLDELRGVVNAKLDAISRLKDELKEGEKKIALFIEVDPEIEVKGKNLLDRRAQELAEKRKREEIQAQKKKAQAIGEQKIDALLDEMRRG